MRESKKQGIRSITVVEFGHKRRLYLDKVCDELKAEFGRPVHLTDDGYCLYTGTRCLVVVLGSTKAEAAAELSKKGAR